MKLIILNEFVCKLKYIPTKEMHSSRVEATGQDFQHQHLAVISIHLKYHCGKY